MKDINRKVVNRKVLKNGSIREEVVYRQGNRDKRIIFVKSATGNDKVKEAMQIVLKDRYVLKD